MQPFDEPGDPPGDLPRDDPADQAGPNHGSPAAARPRQASTTRQPSTTRWLLALLVALVVLVAGTAVWLGTRSSSPPPDAAPQTTEDTGSTVPSTSAGRAPTGVAPPANSAAARRTGTTDLLRGLSAAARAGDRRAYLRLIDPTQRRFRAQQAAVLARLAKVPLDAYALRYGGEGPTLSRARGTALPRGSYVARVSLRYRFAGASSDVDRQLYLTVVPRNGRWLLAGTDDGAAAGFASEKEIWDLGAVDVVRGRSSLVIGDGSRPALRRYAREADQSVTDVSGVWRASWSRRPVVIVPRTQQDLATLIGSDGKGLGQIAAVTTGATESGTTRGDRVVINPAAWRTLGEVGRRVVMAHEVTHLATRAVTVRPVPIWLSEGFADYVAYQAVDLPVQVVGGELLRQVRRGNGPDGLPDDAAFDASAGNIAPAYEGAWLACKLIEERYGQRRLLALYTELADSSGGSVGAQLHDVLGVSERRFERQWLRYVDAQAGR